MSYLQIAILIISMFSFAYIIYATTGSVDAAEAGQVCCEETVLGNSCVNAFPEECNSDFASVPSDCSNTDFCEIGCCISPENGMCNARTGVRDCIDMNGTFRSEAECAIDECEEGCCVYGNNVKWTTYANCQFEGNSQNSDLPTEWLTDEEHNTNIKCMFSLDKFNNGACVYESGDERKCSYLSLEECVLRTGSENNFYKDVFCSSVELDTSCEAKDHQGCIEGEEDVYWFDSCENPEDTAKDCSVLDGTYCGEQGGIFTCRDVNCPEIGKQHGESWCEYDGIIGDGKDPAGSRHVKHVCYLGSERIEPCADFRNEICVQEDNPVSGGTFSQAACRTNQWRVCMNLNQGDSMESKCAKNPDCTIKHIDMGGSFNFKVCTPAYPPGFELNVGDILNDDGSLNEIAYYQAEPRDAICSTATQRCVSTWMCCPGCICIDNCACFTSKFTKDLNDLCISLGDCGGYINYDGEYSGGGYRVASTGAMPGLLSGKFSNTYGGKSAEPGTFEFYENIDSAALSKASGNEGDGILSPFEEELLGISGAYGSTLLLKMLAEDIEDEGSLVDGVSEGGQDEVGLARYTGGYSNNLGDSIRGKIDPFNPPSTDKGGGGGAGIAIAIALTIVAIITSSIIAAMAAALAGAMGAAATPCFIVTQNHDFTCTAWEPPSHGNNCNKCNVEDPPCSEYRCESLGELCQFINKGTSNELCINVPEDETLPAIAPLTSIISEGYEYHNVQDEGFEIRNKNNEGCIEAYNNVRFGIKVSPFARCKYGTNPQQSYDDMSEIFGPKGNVLLPVHIEDFFAIGPEAFRNTYDLSDEEIEALGHIEYFVKCKTASGKINIDTYTIKTCINPGPDLYEPVLSERSEPLNGAYIPYGVEEKEVKIYVNEPAECRWDISDKEFEQMENEFVCETNIEKYTINGLPCTTTLTGVQQDSAFYIKCKDQPWFAGTENEGDRNVMVEGTKYEVFVSEEPLEIDEFRPADGEVITEGFSPVTRNLRLSTIGGSENGDSVCYFQLGAGIEIKFTTTNDSIHEQELNSLMSGRYTVNFKCEDIAGNVANATTSFRVNVDSFGPKIVRVFYDSGLKLITAENAECRYSFKRNFVYENASIMFSSGELEHYADWKLQTYYVQCEDEQKNRGAQFKIKAYDLV